MDYKLVKTFIAVWEDQSFNKAAEKLGYVQSTISTHIANLEEYLQQKLFVRLSQGVVATQAGKEFARYAYRFLDLHLELKETMSTFDKPRGQVKISALETFCAAVMPNLLIDFIAAYPEIDVYIETGFLDDIATKVIKQEVELGIVPRNPKQKELEFTPLRDEKLVFILAKQYASYHQLELRQLKVISFGRTCIYTALAEQALKELGFAERRGMEFSSIDTIKKLVSCGMGLALVPEYCVERELDSGQLVTSQFLPAPILTTGLVCLKNRSLSQVTILMRDFIVARLKHEAT